MRNKKYMPWLLMAAMLVTSVSPAFVADAEEDTGLQNQVLNLKFEDNLTDSSTVAHNVAMGKGDASYTDGVANGKALNLTGNSYVKLGMETDLQPENLTLSFWLKPNADMSGEQVISWNKDEWNTDGWYLTAENANTPLALSVGPELTGEKQPYKVSVSGMTRAEFFPTGEWTHVVVTYDSSTKEVSYYRNGVKCQSEIKYEIAGDRTGVIGSNADMEKSIGYNGPKYSGAYLNATLDEYQLYNDVATSEEVIALYEAGGGQFDKEAVAQADLDVLSVPTEVTGDITLPTTGASGSVITWTSNDTNVITADGKVTRPAVGEKDKEVTLTASASYLEGDAATKTYTVKVLAKQEINISTDSIMADVTLLDDYLVNAASKEDDYLLSLDSEKFLYEIYLLSGLEPTTESGYEGWERSTDKNFRGHAFGHYMSALSQAYLSSDDEMTKAALKTEIQEAVNGLKKCQDAYAALYPESAGYVSPFSEAWLKDKDGVNLVGAPKKANDDVYVPYYNLHKILAGLIDVTKNVDDQEIKETALTVSQGFGDYLYKRLIEMKADKNKMLATEYGGMNEALYELYNITGNDHYKAVAEMFDETTLFQELADGKDPLSGKHANTTIPKLIGALKRYTVLTSKKEDCDEMYLTAAKNFWDITINDHTYITGGNSQSEHFHDADAIGYDATKGVYDASTTCETCNTYNMLKLSKALYQVTGDKKYMDYFENTYINAILSSQNPETGTTMYFQPMAPGYNKVFNRPYDEFWCCTGTGMENFSKLGDNIYQINEDGVSVHMFFSSELNDMKHNLVLTQTANMPNEDTVSLEVKSADAGTVIRLRKPDWLAGEAKIQVNGEAIELKEEAGYYLVSVNAGDKITYQMPMKMEAYRMTDIPNLIAFKYGPVVLSTGLSINAIEAYNPNGIAVRVGTFDSTCQTVITVESETVDKWLENLAENMVRIEDSADGQIQFKLQNVDSKSKELIYTPHYMRYKERYGLYMYMEVADSESSQDRILEEKQKIRNEEMSVDSLYSFDANNSEAAKNQQGENTSVGVWESKGYRDAKKNGWFSYDLKIDTEAEKNYLNCTYYSGDAGRKFDLYINDNLLKTVVINKEAGEKVFYVDTTEIPAEYLTEGSDTITVRFQSKSDYNSYVGGLYGISTATSFEYDTNASLSALTFAEGTLTTAFDPAVTEYVLEVPKDTESVNMTATPMMESGLVYVGDILIDDKNARNIALTDDETTIALTTKAQDHKTEKIYTITVKKVDTPESEVPTVTELKIQAPAKLEYKQGESLDLTGMTVTAVYSDNSEKDVTADATVSGFDGSKTGKQTITVTYDEKNATFEVEVKAADDGGNTPDDGGNTPDGGDSSNGGDNNSGNGGDTSDGGNNNSGNNGNTSNGGDTNNGNSGNNNSGNKADNTSGKTENTGNTGNTVQTGDETPIGILLAAVVSALGVIYYCCRRKGKL